MKHKTAELSGALLDAAVAKALGWSLYDTTREERGFAPSTDWKEGGPIIEREQIATLYSQWGFQMNPGWEAFVGELGPERLDSNFADGEGPTPLIAAMRAYVRAKLGDEVELPE